MTSIAAPIAPVPHASARRWQVRELVMLGVFSAAAKLSTLLVALVGGGLNPVTLMAKNCIFTTLLVVLLFKIRKPGTLTLFMVVNFIISLMLLGRSFTLLIPLVIASALAEGLMWLSGGQEKPWGPYIGVGVYDFVSKALSLGMSWLMVRENPGMVYLVVPIVLIGWFGSVIGLFFGYKSVKELRHAGFIAR